jgi:hypothetical protein
VHSSDASEQNACSTRLKNPHGPGVCPMWKHVY